MLSTHNCFAYKTHFFKGTLSSSTLQKSIEWGTFENGSQWPLKMLWRTYFRLDEVSFNSKCLLVAFHVFAKAQKMWSKPLLSYFSPHCVRLLTLIKKKRNLAEKFQKETLEIVRKPKVWKDWMKFKDEQ